MSTHSAAAPWANIPRPRTTNGPRAGFTDPAHAAEEDWRKHAACAETDLDLHFPIGNTGPALLQIQDAKDVCARCPSIDACLSFALATGMDHGVWGGASEDERKAMKRREARQRQKAAQS